ncbi:MAG: hypothetical protein CMJ49_05125 [Planctomycetaceae bacterium]|nr:hypothetical protein [Planctomycetaceae bacterium]
MDHQSFGSLLPDVAELVGAAGVFAAIELKDDVLLCTPTASDVDGGYELRWDATSARAYVGFSSPDRWLSESIEADLMHCGDDLDELIEDELAELGEDYRPPVEHFRNDQMRYVFRSAVPTAAVEDAGAADRMCRLLLACEAALGHLGQMSGPEDE